MMADYLLCLIFISIFPSVSYAQLVFPASSSGIVVPAKSWKHFRGEGVVKQNSDYSCGSASLSTVLGFYGVEITEKQLMEAMPLYHLPLNSGAFGEPDLHRLPIMLQTQRQF
ncbi:cysteine peptidase family C39 domain-containing protein [Cupriavidus sp. CuC1]|uniref:cysteine peptidase family C39 domain-containing protein n=1 Tax=Cupriavidus sp. CuC1 TaxID=3373131 RepID=UPI0037D3ED2D